MSLKSGHILKIVSKPNTDGFALCSISAALTVFIERPDVPWYFVLLVYSKCYVNFRQGNCGTDLLPL